jgi:hypothetical protein
MTLRLSQRPAAPRARSANPVANAGRAEPGIETRSEMRCIPMNTGTLSLPAGMCPTRVPPRTDGTGSLRQRNTGVPRWRPLVDRIGRGARGALPPEGACPTRACRLDRRPERLTPCRPRRPGVAARFDVCPRGDLNPLATPANTGPATASSQFPGLPSATGGTRSAIGWDMSNPTPSAVRNVPRRAVQTVAHRSSEATERSSGRGRQARE